MPQDIRSNSIFEEDFFSVEATLIVGSVARSPGVPELLATMHEQHPRTAQHMADVALLAGAILTDLTALDPIDELLVRATITAAMVHDVGKSHDTIAPLIDYPGVFSPVQRQAMHMHTQYGADMVARSTVPDRELVSDIVCLHHADRDEIEAFITTHQYDEHIAHQVRFGTMIVAVADVFEATMPIGAENSHASYGNRYASFDDMARDVYDPLAERLPTLPDTGIVLAIAKMFSRARVAEYTMRQLVAA